MLLVKQWKEEINVLNDRDLFWSTLDKNTAADAILTGHVESFEDMPVFQDVISLCGTNNIVLDFGCGVGRNMKALLQKNNTVVGFDFPNMVSMCMVPGATSNWEDVIAKKYDVVLASLVFQHIHPEDLKEYMKYLMAITPKIVLHSRTWFDFTGDSVKDFFSGYDNIFEEVIDTDGDHFLSILHIK